MRTIQVSTDVFAAIWRDRQEGEHNEDQMLRRRYGLPKPSCSNGADSSDSGVHDPRYGVRFVEGFEIFRTYKGKEYRARAESGAWKLLNTGVRYSTLRALSQAVVGHENAWDGWRYTDPSGKRRPISDMRDPSKINRRGSRQPDNSDDLI
jgi:hypothetical protein